MKSRVNSTWLRSLPGLAPARELDAALSAD